MRKTRVRIKKYIRGNNEPVKGYTRRQANVLLGKGRSSSFEGEYNPKQLSLGIKIEKEHTADEEIARRIAQDHLAEHANYYTELVRMEKRLEKKNHA